MTRGCKRSTEGNSSAISSSEVETRTGKSEVSSEQAKAMLPAAAGGATPVDQLSLKIPGGVTETTSDLSNILTPSPRASSGILADDEAPVAASYLSFLDQIKEATLTEGQRRGDFKKASTPGETGTGDKVDETSVPDSAGGRRPTHMVGAYLFVF